MTLNLNKSKKFIEKHHNGIILGIILLFLFIRIYNLDCDLPNFGILQYQPIDEGLYSKITLNLYNNNTISDHHQLHLVTGPHLLNNIIGQLLQLPLMYLFGDNYYGFRMVSVIFAILLLYYTNKCIDMININVMKKRCIWSNIIISLFFTFEFTLTISNRVVETSLLRALIVVMTIYYFFKLSNNLKIKWFVTGVLTTLSITLVYISNVFLMLSVIIVFIYSMFNETKKERLTILFYFILGIFLVFLASELYYCLVWNTTFLKNTIDLMGLFSNRVTAIGEKVSLFSVILLNINDFFTSNLFFFDLPLLLSFIISLFLGFIYISKAHINEIHFFLFSILISFILQISVTNDYIIRKSIIIMPICYLFIYITFLMVKRDIKMYSRRKNDKNFYLIIFFMIVILTIIIIWNMIELRITKNMFLDFKDYEIKLWLGGTFLFIISMLMIFLDFTFVKNHSREKKILIVMWCCSLIINMIFTISYTIVNKNYSEKNNMIALGEKYGDKMISGSYIYGYTLYNDIHPIGIDNDEYKEYVGSNKLDYFFDFHDLDGTSYMDTMFIDKKNVILDSIVKRDFQVYGKIRNMAVYKIK